MQINKLKSHPLKSAFALGLISTLSLPPFYVLPVLFLTLISLLILINEASSAKESFKIGYFFGFAYFASNLSWIGNALLIDALHFGWLYPITLIAAGSFFGLFTGIPTLICFYFKNITSKYLAFASLWTIFEWIRSFILTGFPWNLLGSIWSFNPKFIQITSIIGTYGLSLISILIFASPALIIANKTKKSLYTSIITSLSSFLLIFIFGICHFKNYEQGSTKIRIVQPSIPQEMKWNKESLEKNFNEYIQMSAQVGQNDVDFVIWGETATPLDRKSVV